MGMSLVPGITKIPGIFFAPGASTGVMTATATAPVSPPPLDAAHLPDDLALCHRLIAELLATSHTTQRSNEQLRHRLDQLRAASMAHAPNATTLTNPLWFGEPEPTPDATRNSPSRSHTTGQAAAGKKATPHGRRVSAQKPTPRTTGIRIDGGRTRLSRLRPTAATLWRRGQRTTRLPTRVVVRGRTRASSTLAHCQEHVAVAAGVARSPSTRVCRARVCWPT